MLSEIKGCFDAIPFKSYHTYNVCMLMRNFKLLFCLYCRTLYVRPIAKLGYRTLKFAVLEALAASYEAVKTWLIVIGGGLIRLRRSH